MPTRLDYFGTGPNAPPNQKRQTRIPSHHNSDAVGNWSSSFMMAPLTRSAASVGTGTRRSQVKLFLCLGASATC